MNSQTIIGVPDVDEYTLLKLDYPDLRNACRTYRSFNRICKKQSFWAKKIKYDFGSGIIQHKPLDINNEEEYVYLYNLLPATVDKLERAAYDDRMDGVLVVLNKGIKPSNKFLLWVIEKEDINLLQKLNLPPPKYGLDLAYAKGNPIIISWLSQLKEKPYMRTIVYAGGIGSLENLKWLFSFGWNLSECDGILCANYASLRGNLEHLKFLATKGIHPDQYGVDWAAENHHQHVLDWLSTLDYYPSQTGLHRA